MMGEIQKMNVEFSKMSMVMTSNPVAIATTTKSIAEEAKLRRDSINIDNDINNASRASEVEEESDVKLEDFNDLNIPNGK